VPIGPALLELAGLLLELLLPLLKFLALAF
jgi:hypothetical protein